MKMRQNYADGFSYASAVYSASFVVQHAYRTNVWDVHWRNDVGVATEYCVYRLRECI